MKRNRELTEIEQTLLKRVIDRVCDALKEAWHNVVPIDPELDTLETNPQLFLQLYLPTEMVILMTFEVTVGENAGATSICIPYPVLEPVVQKLSAKSWFSGFKKKLDPENREILRQRISEATMDIKAYLGINKLRVREILDLQQGDVIPLDADTDGVVSVHVGGKPRFKGQPGAMRKHRAVQITATTTK
jgi:flagellar motor switch protein FliM